MADINTKKWNAQGERHFCSYIAYRTTRADGRGQKMTARYGYEDGRTRSFISSKIRDRKTLSWQPESPCRNTSATMNSLRGE